MTRKLTNNFVKTASVAAFIAAAATAPLAAQDATVSESSMIETPDTTAQLVGQGVFDANGTQVGTIDEVYTDVDGTEMAVLSVGGFLGLGAKKITVATADLQVSADGSGFTTTMTPEEIEAAPEYVSDSTIETPAEEY